jgi:hypothetical protein
MSRVAAVVPAMAHVLSVHQTVAQQCEERWHEVMKRVRAYVQNPSEKLSWMTVWFEASGHTQAMKSKQRERVQRVAYLGKISVCHRHDEGERKRLEQLSGRLQSNLRAEGDGGGVRICDGYFGRGCSRKVCCTNTWQDRHPSAASLLTRN